MSEGLIGQRADAVRAALAQVNEHVEQLERLAEGQIEDLRTELEHARYPGLHEPCLLIPLVGDVTAAECTWSPQELAIVGAGPWSRDQLFDFLVGLGFVVVDEPAADTALILGARDVTDADLDAVLLACQAADEELHLYSQELFLLGLIRRINPLAVIGDEQVLAIAREHGPIAELLSRGLTWPLSPFWQATDETDDQGDGQTGHDDQRWEHDTDDWRDQSVLGTIGYSVKDGELTVAQRRSYLESAFEDDLSEIADERDLARWGDPGTSARLRALVSYMLWLNRFQSADKPAARQKRLEDLRWLRTRYPGPASGFSWPSLIDAGGTTRRARAPNAAFMKNLMPSPELAAVVGPDAVPRTEIVSRLWAYIKRHRLQDSVNKRLVNTDGPLRKVFGKSQVSMFEMAGLIERHVR